jgi:chromosomal replication initiator protein
MTPGPGGEAQRLTGAALAQVLLEGSAHQTLQQFWEAVQQSIMDRLGHERYSIWFRQTELMSGSREELVVGVPNVIIQQYLSLRYSEAVEGAVEELTGRPMRVSFDVAPRLFRQMRARQEEEEQQDAGQQAAGKPPPAASSRAPAPPANWGFEHLIVTAANRVPYAAAREVAGQANPRFRFLYICGDYGQGKTALLRAIYALACGPERGLQAVFTSTEDWCNDFYHAIQQKRTRVFRSKHRSCRTLILDDLQFIQGKAAAQSELLHTAKQVLQEGGRVVLAGKPHPEAFQDVDPAFQALLRRAFPALILPPDAEERKDIVAELARRRGLKTTDEVCRYVADRFGDGFGRMESAVSCLSLYAGVEGCGRLTLAAARAALAAMQAPEKALHVGLEQIRQAVVQVFGVSVKELTGSGRSRSVCRARHVGMYLGQKMTGSSLTEIGRCFGASSHSTVKHAVDKIEKAVGEDERLAALVRQVQVRAAAT